MINYLLFSLLISRLQTNRIGACVSRREIPPVERSAKWLVRLLTTCWCRRYSTHLGLHSHRRKGNHGLLKNLAVCGGEKTCCEVSRYKLTSERGSKSPSRPLALPVHQSSLFFETTSTISPAEKDRSGSCKRSVQSFTCVAHCIPPPAR
jgi:hypothetical protein